MEYILCPYMFSPYTEKQRQVFWGYNAGAHLWLIEKFWRQLITKGDLSRSFAVVLSLSKWLLKRQIQLKWISSVPEDNVSLVIMPHFLSVLLLTIEPRFLLTQARQAFHHWAIALASILMFLKIIYSSIICAVQLEIHCHSWDQTSKSCPKLWSPKRTLVAISRELEASEKSSASPGLSFPIYTRRGLAAEIVSQGHASTNVPGVSN